MRDFLAPPAPPTRDFLAEEDVETAASVAGRPAVREPRDSGRRVEPGRRVEVTARVHKPFTFRGRVFRRGEWIEAADPLLQEALDARPECLLVHASLRPEMPEWSSRA